MLWIGLVVAVVLLGAHLWASWRFDKRLEAYVDALRQNGLTVTKAKPDSLPTVINKFARETIAEDKNRPTIVRLRQTGKMRMSESGRWLQFEAVQYIAVRQLGFLWKADFRLAPLIHFEVADSYFRNAGQLQGRLLGSIPLIKAEGEGITKGQLMRYLAEIPWFADAIFCNPALDWRDLGQRSVEVASRSGPVAAAVHLKFDEAGRIIQASTNDRPRMVDGREVPTRWSGRFSDYQKVSGYYIPTRAEACWELDSGTYTYWRATITELTVDP